MIRFHLTISGTCPDATTLEEAEVQLDYALDSKDWLTRGLQITERTTKVARE